MKAKITISHEVELPFYFIETGVLEFKSICRAENINGEIALTRIGFNDENVYNLGMTTVDEINVKNFTPATMHQFNDAMTKLTDSLERVLIAMELEENREIIETAEAAR